MALAAARDHPHRSRWTARAGLAVSAAAVGWGIRHRSSPAVRCWRRGGGAQRTAGELSVRSAGGGHRAVVLLHGLTANGDFFGAGYDLLADDAQLAIPDLRGFGRSLDVHSGGHSLDAHLAALDLMARELQLDGRELTVAGHSFGALLALHWAARRSDVVRVVCFGAPLYADSREADERIAAMGRMEQLFAPQGSVSRAVCGWMCRNRAIAQWVAVAIEPRLPVAIARMAVLHSWASYLGAMNSVIRRAAWQTPLAALDAAGVTVLLADGARDPVPSPGRTSELATRYANVAIATHATAGHHLPITHPSWCVNLLTDQRGHEHHDDRPGGSPRDRSRGYGWNSGRRL